MGGMLAAGCIGIGVGVAADLTGFWKDWPFVTNLVSSFTTVMFGVPTALFFVGWLTGVQTQEEQVRKIRRRVRREVAEFRDALLNHLAATDLRDLSDALETVETLMDEQPNRQDNRAQHQEAVLTAVGELLPPHLATLGSWWQPRVANRVYWPVMQEWAATVRTGWQLIDGELRPLVIELDEPWLNSRSRMSAVHAADRLQAPGRNPWLTARDAPQDLRGPRPKIVQHFVTDAWLLTAAAVELCDMYAVPTATQTDET